MPLMVALLDLEGTEGRVFAFQDGEHYVGRLPQSSIQLPDSSSVSRLHARIYTDEGVWRIEDLRSRNGVTIHGRPIRNAVLSEGDLVGIGEVFFMFTHHGPDDLANHTDQIIALRGRAEDILAEMVARERGSGESAPVVEKKITAGFSKQLVSRAGDNPARAPVVSQMILKKPLPQARVPARAAGTTPPKPVLTARSAPPRPAPKFTPGPAPVYAGPAQTGKLPPAPVVTGPDTTWIIVLCVVGALFIAAVIWKFVGGD